MGNRPSEPDAISRCRDCGCTAKVWRYEYYKASRPRCTACGGTMDYPFTGRDANGKQKPKGVVTDLSSLVLSFSGSCTPNPGGIPVYGWLLTDIEGDVIECTSGLATGKGGVLPTGWRTNNAAEWLGLIEGLKWLKSQEKPLFRLEIRGDSDLVIKTVNGVWKSKKEHLKQFHEQYRKLISDMEIGQVVVLWIPKSRNMVAEEVAKAGAR